MWKLRYSRQRQISVVLALAAGAALIAALVLSGHSSSAAQTNARLAVDARHAGPAFGPSVSRALSPGETFIPGVGAYWLPATPAQASSAVVSAAFAEGAAKVSGIRDDVTQMAHPEASLALFSNDVKGKIQADGSVVPDDVDKLAWVLRYIDAPVVSHHGLAVPSDGSVVHDPAGATSPVTGNCDFYAVVDAMTGIEIEAFQSCGREVG